MVPYKMLKLAQKHLEYVPLVLLGIFLASESEMDKKTLSTMWNLLLSFTILVIIYVAVSVLKCKKTITLALAVIIWIFFIYLKRCIMPENA